MMGPCTGTFCRGQWRCALPSSLLRDGCRERQREKGRQGGREGGGRTGRAGQSAGVTFCCVCRVRADYIGICANIPVFQGVGCSASALTSAFRIDTRAACPPSTSCECELMGIDTRSQSTLGVRALDDNNGFLLQNRRGTTRSIEISVVCDRSVPEDNPPDPVTDAANHVTMTWRTPVICPSRSDLGWMFLIVTGVAAGLYVGGGIGYAKHQVRCLEPMHTMTARAGRHCTQPSRSAVALCGRTQGLRSRHLPTHISSCGGSCRSW